MHSSLPAALFVTIAASVTGAQASSVGGNSLAQDGYDKLAAEIKRVKGA